MNDYDFRKLGDRMGLIVATLPLLADAQEPSLVKYNVALIAATASVLAAILTAVLGFFFNRKNQKDLELLRARLTQETQLGLEQTKSRLLRENQTQLEAVRAHLNAQGQQELELLRTQLKDVARNRDAQRDYEYEARKRLYQQCEPLLFQLAEFSESALYRIYSLARTARHGNLPSWVDEDDYYMRSTMYFLISPLIILRLIQSQLTFVDLTLDSHIARQYSLLKLLFLTFTDDFTFAHMPPAFRLPTECGQLGASPEGEPRQVLEAGTHYRDT